LLVIVGVMSIGIQSTLGIQHGFDARRLYLTCLDPVRDGFSPSQTEDFFDRLLERVRDRPWSRPARGRGDYFETTGIPILAGRSFRKEDKFDGSTAVMVSAELVREFWNGPGCIERRVEIGGDRMAPSVVLPGTYDYRSRTASKLETFDLIGATTIPPKASTAKPAIPRQSAPTRR
jgi:hypothetical protein